MDAVTFPLDGSFDCETCARRVDPDMMGEMPYECYVCFCRDHPIFGLFTVKLHTNRYQCITCSKYFDTRDCLERHAVSHTRAKLHACASCGRAFARRADLIRHGETHTRRARVCGVCGKAMFSDDAFASHVRGHLLGYPCSTCTRRFGSRGHLTRHERTHGTRT